ncbi:glycosyltransferase family 2 protein [Bacillus cereus]|uniref:Glycosyltransferase 2-like domain-containing protein n=1 Tax=Bacillus cereus HuA4-10 TaxID=1053206 RepID=J8DZ79_BACCE|nr:glycosyltransferase [Bacillus cereus]EJQ81634.1 hypothetical protein IGC_01873 [Bacillus cereus HuA4-10]
MNKVSVIVPIYNAGRMLEKCISSILNQTFNDFELILVNDGSTDNSLEICNIYKKKDKRITVISKKNEGSIATRRRGIEASNGHYVMFVDADDWINKYTIEILYNQSIKDSVDITVCNMYRVIGRSTLIKKKFNSWYFDGDKLYNAEEIKRDLVTAYFHGHPFPPSLCAKLYKKELLEKSGKYLERIRFLGDDLFYNMEIMLKANKIKVIDNPLYYYQQGGFTSKYQEYLFGDMINGYLIQEEVIREHYQNTFEKKYTGISIMLLNTFKTCLLNLFKNNFSEHEIKARIQKYVSNDVLIKCISNEGAISYFSEDYLSGIRNRNIDFLFDLGRKLHRKSRAKKILVNLVSIVC